MKKIIILSIIIVLVLLFGSLPLSILGNIFKYLAIGINWLAKGLNWFGWNGLL